MKQPITLNTSETPLAQTHYEQAVRTYIKAGTSDNTRKTYRSAIRQFEKWGGRLPCESEALIRYAIHKIQSINPRTIDLHITAISQWHKQQGISDPTQNITLKKTLEGMRRLHIQPAKKAKPLQISDVITLLNYLESLPDDLRKIRDRALILTAFMGAFRRSELVEIQVKDLEWESQGLKINMKKSKTDQQGQGSSKALPFSPSGACAATAIKQWIDLSNIKEGALLCAINRWGQISSKALHDGAINSILKDRANQAGLENPSEFSSHSFRRGHATSAARAGVDFRLIKKQGGWKSDASVYRYIEDGTAMQENSSITLMNEFSNQNT
ncbi:site-specific integrase [Marinicellulosiphila megalodicopiae]|uniref:site-specific integrase n=1 Tax=Marinicellulosiphila megalodicopiae TaxID=2724896 RepID=UPI003BB11845